MCWSTNTSHSHTTDSFESISTLLAFYVAHRDVFAQRFWPDARLPPPPLSTFNRAHMPHVPMESPRPDVPTSPRPSRIRGASEPERHRQALVDADIDNLMRDVGADPADIGLVRAICIIG